LGPFVQISEKYLRLFCSNVRGLVCNWSSVTAFDWSQYDIVALNEVWNIKDFENMKVDNFEIKTSRIRQNRRGGGTVIFGRKELVCKILTTPFIEGCIETSGLSTCGVVFLNIYRPPGGNKDDFSRILLQYISSLNGRRLIIGGDFNVNRMADVAWYDNLCLGYGLETKIANITRVESGSCIDNYLSNIEGVYEVSNICIADHQAITAKLEVSNITISEKPKIHYRQLKEHDFAQFNHRLYNDVVIEGDNIELKWLNLQKSIHTLVEECFPIKSCTKKYVFNMSRGLMKSRDKKNKI